MVLKALALGSMLAIHPLPSEANQVPNDRLCISQESKRVVQDGKIYVSGIFSCVGVDTIPEFNTSECTQRIIKPAEFMLEQVYTSCPYKNAVLQQ